MCIFGGTYQRTPSYSHLCPVNICSLIRCWDVTSLRETYRITIGLGGLGSGPELCVWSLLSLR